MATPLNLKKGLIFPPDLKSAMRKFNGINLKGFTKDERDPELLKQYLDDYKQIPCGIESSY